jgi:hypothetical protein
MHQTIQATRTCISEASVSDQLVADGKAECGCTVSLPAQAYRASTRSRPQFSAPHHQLSVGRRPELLMRIAGSAEEIVPARDPKPLRPRSPGRSSDR